MDGMDVGNKADPHAESAAKRLAYDVQAPGYLLELVSRWWERSGLVHCSQTSTGPLPRWLSMAVLHSILLTACGRGMRNAWK